MKHIGLALLLLSAPACGLDVIESSSPGTSGGKESTSTSSSSSATGNEATTGPGTSSNTGDGTGTGSAPQPESSSASTEGSSSGNGNSSSSSSSPTDPTSEGSTEGNSSSPSGDSSGDSSGEPGKINCDELKFSGHEVGQVPKAVSLLDSDGKAVQLRDYCNDVVIVISGDST